MAIRSIDILNVMVFKRHRRTNKEGQSGSDTFHMDFSKHINIIIGENGVGKTTLLKMIYTAGLWSIEGGGTARKGFLELFSNHLKDNHLVRSNGIDEFWCFEVSDGEHHFNYSLLHDGVSDFDQWKGLNIQSVYIPATEMLSHSRGFLAMNHKYSLPFDVTQVDIIANASLPEPREITPIMEKTLGRLSGLINGKVIQKDDVFYVEKRDGSLIDFSLEAEGYRKIGLLWKLIRNGLLEPGAVLLWDEPEANLNPELYPVVAEILLELAQNGVQVFAATHSYNFAKYLEIRRKSEEDVLFHNLYRQRDEATGENVVYSSSAPSLEALPNNPIMKADNELLDEVFNL